jgi:hypothetical protein
MQNLFVLKVTCKRTLRQPYIWLRPSPLLGFYLGLGRQFRRYESGQKESVRALQNMISNTTELPHPPPPAHTHTVCIYLVTRGRVKLETMPLNISWSKFQKKITTALASSFLYGVTYEDAERIGRKGQASYGPTALEGMGVAGIG